MKSPGLSIEPDSRYTVWGKHPHSGNWLLERSYYGTYFDGEGALYLKSQTHYVTEEGRDPAGGRVGNMAFMQPEYTNEDFYEVTNDSGEGTLVPAGVVGKVEEEIDPADFVDYIEFGKPEEIELVSGWFARLSAPGYMDSTDWGGPFKTKKEAEKYIEDTWDVDPETGDSLEENPKRESNANRRDVIQAWAAGKKKKASALRTEGGKLYSYDLLIGETLPDGTRVVYDYTGSNRISQTTTTHVNAAKAVADKVSEPLQEPFRPGARVRRYPSGGGMVDYPSSRNPDYMTKKQFEDEFKASNLFYVIEVFEKDGVPDRPARREAWNNAVDAAIKDGRLPERAADWTHPRWLETYRGPRNNPAPETKKLKAKLLR